MTADSTHLVARNTGTSTATAQRPATAPGGFLSGTGRPLAFYFASRLLTLLVALVAATNPGWSVLKFLTTWDSGWYLEIIRHGYPAAVPQIAGQATESTIVFFPLYPLTVRGVTWALPVSDAVAAIAVSMLFGAIAVVVLVRLVRAFADPDTADRAAILFSFFPGSMVLSMAYSEGLLITMTVACLLALLQRRWLVAGATAALATACRANGIALVGACVWQSAVAIRERREWRSLIAPVLAPAGIIAFFTFLWVRTGEATAWFRVQREGWHQEPDLGRSTLRFLASFVRSPLSDLQVAIVVLGLIFTAVSLGILVRRRWPGVLTVYSLLVLALSVSSRIDSVRPRDILTAFPLLVAVAHVSRGKAFTRLVTVCGVCLVWLMFEYNLYVLNQP